MIPLMLDTSAYAAFKLGDSTVLEAIRKSPKILIPLIVFGELLAGFEAGSRREQNRQELTAFLRSPRVRLVPVIVLPVDPRDLWGWGYIIYWKPLGEDAIAGGEVQRDRCRSVFQEVQGKGGRLLRHGPASEHVLALLYPR